MSEGDVRRPANQRLQAQMAAHISWTNTADRAARTAKARAAAMDRFDRQVDPEGKMAPAERAKRAESARKAHYARMAYNSVRARRARTESSNR
jgi:hypothetical protein